MNPRRTTLFPALAATLLLASAGAAHASNYAVDEIPQTIPAADALKLKGAGIPTTYQLLEKAGDAHARKALAKTVRIPEKTLEMWVQLADVMRIRGIGPDVARLLAAANIHTVTALKTADATKVSDDIAKANSKLHLSENPPSEEHLKAWIEQASTLPIVLK